MRMAKQQCSWSLCGHTKKPEMDSPRSQRRKIHCFFHFLQPQPQGNFIVGGRIMATTDVENSKGGMSFVLTRGAMVPRSRVICLLLVSLSSSYLAQIQMQLQEVHSRAGKLKAQFSGLWAGKGDVQETR